MVELKKKKNNEILPGNFILSILSCYLESWVLISWNIKNMIFLFTLRGLGEVKMCSHFLNNVKDSSAKVWSTFLDGGMGTRWDLC